MKRTETWHSEQLGQDITVVRWGEMGTPVLVFPTAGGDAHEIERMGVIDALGLLLADARIKVYSVDSVAGRAWMESADPLHAAWLQNRYDEAIRWEVVPAIRTDCQNSDIEIVTAGASFGAFNAVEVLCRHPKVFRAAIGMSGTYDLTPWLRGAWSDDFYFSSPLHYLPGLGESEQLSRLQHRFVILATGTGDHEDAGQSWAMADVLGRAGVPNRVDNWPGWSHDWPTWHQMLPVYLHELVP